LFGDGKTAVKTNIARYVTADNANTANVNDPQRRSASPTRALDRPNGDFTIYNPDGSVCSTGSAPRPTRTGA
jgi:hypothetical protein